MRNPSDVLRPEQQASARADLQDGPWAICDCLFIYLNMLHPYYLAKNRLLRCLCYLMNRDLAVGYFTGNL